MSYSLLTPQQSEDMDPSQWNSFDDQWNSFLNGFDDQSNGFSNLFDFNNVNFDNVNIDNVNIDNHVEPAVQEPPDTVNPAQLQKGNQSIVTDNIQETGQEPQAYQTDFPEDINSPEYWQRMLDDNNQGPQFAIDQSVQDFSGMAAPLQNDAFAEPGPALESSSYDYNAGSGLLAAGPGNGFQDMQQPAAPAVQTSMAYSAHFVGSATLSESQQVAIQYGMTYPGRVNAPAVPMPQHQGIGNVAIGETAQNPSGSKALADARAQTEEMKKRKAKLVKRKQKIAEWKKLRVPGDAAVDAAEKKYSADYDVYRAQYKVVNQRRKRLEARLGLYVPVKRSWPSRRREERGEILCCV